MTTYQNLLLTLQSYGVMDFLLPFVLVFTIVYAVLKKTKILGQSNFNLVVALVIGLLFVVPHLTGGYPTSFNPVEILNQTLPSIALISVAAIMLLLLMGVFGTKFSKAAAPWIAFFAIAFVIYVFGSSLNFWIAPYDIFPWWDESIWELVIIILVFGLVVWFIMREPDQQKESVGGKFLQNIENMFEKD